MQWEKAKMHELYTIAFDDPYAEPLDVHFAKTEINRRKKEKHARLKQTEIKTYPK